MDNELPGPSPAGREPAPFSIGVNLILALPLTFITFLLGLAVFPLLTYNLNRPHANDIWHYYPEEMILLPVTAGLLLLFYLLTRRNGGGRLVAACLVLGLFVAFMSLYIVRL